MHPLPGALKEGRYLRDPETEQDLSGQACPISAHLLEGIAVVAFDPETATIDANLPKPGSGLRWDEFVNDLVTAYRARFED